MAHTCVTKASPSVSGCAQHANFRVIEYNKHVFGHRDIMVMRVWIDSASFSCVSSGRSFSKLKRGNKHMLCTSVCCVVSEVQQSRAENYMCTNKQKCPFLIKWKIQSPIAIVNFKILYFYNILYNNNNNV